MTVGTAAIAYALMFAALAAGDLGSTLFGQAAGATEFNPTVSTGGQIDVARFVVLNAVVGGVIVGMLAWALAHARHAEPSYMRSPWRAALSWLTYLNPFSTRNQPRAVFHWAAIAVSLVLVRLFAITNNLAISLGVPDVLTPVARAVSSLFTGSLVYAVTTTIIIAPLWLASLYLVPLVLRRATTTEGDPVPAA